MCADQVGAYLAELVAQAPFRPVTASRRPQAIAARDPRRHFHILGDDKHYAIRVSRALPAQDPYVAALFGVGPARVKLRS